MQTPQASHQKPARLRREAQLEQETAGHKLDAQTVSNLVPVPLTALEETRLCDGCHLFLNTRAWDAQPGHKQCWRTI